MWKTDSCSSWTTFSSVLPSIFPSPDQPASVPVLPPAMNTGGSLPDLTNLHFPPPLPTPLDPEETVYPSLSGGNSTSNLTHTMTHLGISGGLGLGPSYDVPGEWLPCSDRVTVKCCLARRVKGKEACLIWDPVTAHQSPHPRTPHCNFHTARMDRRKMENNPQMGRANLTVRVRKGRTLCCYSLVTATHSGWKGAQFPSVMLASLVFCLCLQDFTHPLATHPCSPP